MTTNLRVTATDWRTLRRHFQRSFRPGFPPETGALGVLGSSSTPERNQFLLAKLFMPEPGDISHADSGALIFSSSYLRRAHLFMRQYGLVGLATFHTHPASTSYVGFSWFDEEQDPQLIENLADIWPGTVLVSVVAGRESQQGRMWTGPSASVDMDELIVVGDHLDYLPLNGKPARAQASPAALFDRGLALTGSGALARLASMKVAVVGASGTGSLMAELLIRAGCQDLMIFDDDVVQDININRILYATTHDAEAGTPKVQVVTRGLESLGLGCKIEAAEANILDNACLLRLREADVVIGCVDRAYPRRVLSQFAYQYFIPYIDVGTEIGGDAAGIVSLDSRLNLVSPMRPCLVCTGLVTPRQLHLESLSYEEQRRHIALGYSGDLLIEQPAVMDLNMRASSMGMLVLRHILQPFLLEPLPVTLSENMVTYRMIAANSVTSLNPNCRTCQVREFMGYGDQGPVIGLSKKMVQRMRAP